MNRKTIIVLCVLCVLGLGGFAWALLQPQDPTFHGKPESEWIKGIAYGMGLSEEQNRAQVHHWVKLGPEGLDVLQRAVGRPPPGHTYRIIRLLFSSTPFPGYSVKLEWRREEFGGNWYWCSKFEMEGWLCPALFKYFAEAPRELYARAERKTE